MSVKSPIVGLVLLAGCAGSAPAQVDAREADEARMTELREARARAAELEAELEMRARELRRLESELALLRSKTVRTESVHISPSTSGAWDEPTLALDEPPHVVSAPSREEGPRVTLKLYGDGAPEQAYQAPRLPVTASSSVPSVPMTIAAEPRAAKQPVQDDEGGEEAYRRALASIRAGKLEPALPLLDTALERATSNTRRIDAAYWRGEVLYILGRFAEAEVEFASIVSLGSAHEKVPSSLLRLGQCRQRRGLHAEAASLFSRLRAEFPESHAAAQLPREDVR